MKYRKDAAANVPYSINASHWAGGPGKSMMLNTVFIMSFAMTCKTEGCRKRLAKLWKKQLLVPKFVQRTSKFEKIQSLFQTKIQRSQVGFCSKELPPRSPAVRSKGARHLARDQAPTSRMPRWPWKKHVAWEVSEVSLLDHVMVDYWLSLVGGGGLFCERCWN